MGAGEGEGEGEGTGTLCSSPIIDVGAVVGAAVVGPTVVVGALQARFLDRTSLLACLLPLPTIMLRLVLVRLTLRAPSTPPIKVELPEVELSPVLPMALRICNACATWAWPVARRVRPWSEMAEARGRKGRTSCESSIVVVY